MKKGVVIGASRDSIHTIKKAREHGIYVVALDGNPNAEGFAYADEKIEVDISDLEKTCTEIQRIKPDFVIPIPIGRYLSTTGYVNEKFQLKGIGYRATVYSTDKFLFHERLSEVGLRDVQLYLINENIGVEQLAIPYPAIMKPRFGSGSRDVFFITKDEELKNAFDYAISTKEDFVLEQAVEGIEYSVDGAVIDGILNITLLRKKIITPLPIRQPISSFSVEYNAENSELFKRVYSKLQKVVERLEYNNCLLNADLIINANDIFVIEIAPRPSGHNLHNVFVPQATGIDIAEEYIKFLLGETFSFETDHMRYLQIRFFDFENVVIKKVPTLQELQESGTCNLVLWNCKIKENDYMNKVINGHSIMDRGFFIVEGKTEEELIAQSTWVLDQFVKEEK